MVKLRKIRIRNFRSIYDLELRPKNLTVLIGRNDSGKTTILEAIRLLFSILELINEEIDLKQIDNREIKEQIEVLPFFSNWEQPIEINALIELDSIERNSKEVRDIILKECGLEEDISCIEGTITITRKDSTIVLGVKELKILGFVSPTTKEVVKIMNSEKITACKVIENYNIINTKVVEAIRNLIKNKVKIIIPYMTYRPSEEKQKLSGIRSLAIIIRNPIISEELIDKVKEAKYNYKFRPKFYEYVMEIEGRESSFERFTDREILSKTYHYISIAYPLFGGGNQVIEGILASIITAMPGSIILIEEPETHQHPAYIKELAKVLETITQERGIQIILTTHSPIFIRALRSKENVIIVRKNYIDTPMGRVPATQASEVKEDVARYLDVLTSELGIPASLPFFADAIILVEGGSDKLLIEHFIDMLVRQNVITFLPTIYYEVITFAQTPGKVSAWIELLKRLKIKTFVIVDSDEEGKRYLRQAINCGLEEGRYAFKLDKDDILCYIPGKIVAGLIVEILNEYFKNIQEKLKDSIEALNNLLDRLKSSNQCEIGIFKGIASLIFESLSEEERMHFNNSEGKFEGWLKTQIAKLAISRNVFNDVPPDIKQILQIIDRNIIER